MILLIVESPTKAKSISSFLSSEYEVVASKGHIREIRHDPFGVDINQEFEAHWEYVDGAEQIVDNLKLKALKATKVLLATDPDREGEAIAWHLSQVLGLDPCEPADC